MPGDDEMERCFQQRNRVTPNWRLDAEFINNPVGLCLNTLMSIYGGGKSYRGALTAGAAAAAVGDFGRSKATLAISIHCRAARQWGILIEADH